MILNLTLTLLSNTVSKECIPITPTLLTPYQRSLTVILNFVPLCLPPFYFSSPY